jgi:hypothetical protein
MNVRNVRLAGSVALLAAAVGAGGACGVVDAARDAAGPSSPAPLEPRDTLLNAVPDGESGSFRFAVKGGDQPMTGVMDAAGKSYTFGISQRDPDLGFTLTMNFLVVGKQSWIKVRFTGAEGLRGLPQLPRKWMLIDPTKIEKKDEDGLLGYAGETDPGDTGAVLRAIVDVAPAGAGRFTGTADLTKQGDAEIVEADTLAALGTKAAAVPFEAAVDGAGRLTRLVVKIPAAGKAKASRYEVTYSDFGKAPSPEVPGRSEQQAATEALYQMVNA